MPERPTGWHEGRRGRRGRRGTTAVAGVTPPPGVPAERDRSAHQSEQRKTIGATAPHFVCRTDELPPGERKIVSANGRSIGVFNVGGRYYALRNLCPHRAAPLCLG